MATRAMDPTDKGGNWPRWVNLFVGVWLFVSAFVWPHIMGSMTNSWVVGVLMAGFAIAAMYQAAMRYANSILAVWLFVFTLVIPGASAATTWNNLLVAVVAFVISMIPNGSGMQRPTRPAHA